MATNINVTEPPEFLRSYYAALAQKGAEAGNLGFTPYGQQRVAPWTQPQQDAAAMIQQRAMSGSGAMDQAGNWYSQMLGGQKDVGGVQAALGPNNIASGGQIGQVNAALGPTQVGSGGVAQEQQNAYAGMDNPYLQKAIGQAQNDVTSRIDSKFNNTGFGGTAHQQTLARELGNVSNNMRMADYSSQQGLAENAVNRNLSNQQYNIGNTNQMNQLNAGYGFQNAGIQNQMGLANAGLQGQNISNQNALNMANANLGFQNAGIQNTTNQFNANQQAGNVGRQQTALGFAPTLAANTYADASALMSLGGQLQGTNQQIADANYQEFLRQQQQPMQSMQYMAAGLQPSSGAFSNQTSTQNTSGSPVAGMIGGGLAGYAAGAGTGWFNPWMGAAAGAVGGGLLGGRG